MRKPFLFMLIFMLCVTSLAQVPKPSKVVMVMLENIPASSITATSMPFIHALTQQQGANFTQFYAETHPSIGNYFVTTTGQIITNNDGYTATIAADNIVRRFLASGITFKSYADSLPYAGYTGGDKYPYSLHHNPFAYFSDVRNSSLKTQVIVPFTQFTTDFINGNLPQFSMVVPNMVHNAHDCPTGLTGCTGIIKLQEADKWIKANLSGLLNSPDFQPGGKGVFIVWFDESSSSDKAYGGGHIFNPIIGPLVKSGSYATHHNHYDLLRTTLAMFGMDTNLGGASTATTISDIWKTTVPPPPVPTPCSVPVGAQIAVAICTPQPGATVSTTVNIVAASSAPSSVTYMQVYIDGVKFGTYFAAAINVNAPLNAGTHRLTVQAVDKNAVLAKSTMYITVK